MPDLDAAQAEFDRSKALQNDIWARAVVVILALTFYVIRDLEFPRLPGLVGLNNFDNVLVELRKSMH